MFIFTWTHSCTLTVNNVCIVLLLNKWHLNVFIHCLMYVWMGLMHRGLKHGRGVVAIVFVSCVSVQFITEFDLRSVQYEVKSPRSHEMRLATPPHDCIRFNFRCDREAEEWATVVMSSLREAHRGLMSLSSSACHAMHQFSLSPPPPSQPPLL